MNLLAYGGIKKLGTKIGKQNEVKEQNCSHFLLDWLGKRGEQMIMSKKFSVRFKKCNEYKRCAQMQTPTTHKG